jgi:hypothetical protein
MMAYCDVADYSPSGAVQAPWAKRLTYTASQRPTPGQLVNAERNMRIVAHASEAIVHAQSQGQKVSSFGIENFKRLVDLLPAYLPVTEPYVAHTGSVTFDWDEDPQNQLALILQSSGRISFAAYFSGEKVNGSADFNGSSLPQSVVDTAARWNKRRA